MPEHLEHAVVVDVEPVLAGALGEDQVLDDVGEQPALHRDEQEDQEPRPERDADHPAALQEGEAAVPDDHRGLQRQREQRRRGDREHRGEGDEAGRAEAPDRAAPPEQEVDVGEDEAGEQAEVDRMREGRRGAGEAEPLLRQAGLLHRHDGAEDHLEQLRPGQELEEREGEEHDDEQQHGADEAAVARGVAHQHPADQVGAEQLDEVGADEDDARQAVHHDERDRDPDAAREKQQVDGGDRPGAAADPAQPERDAGGDQHQAVDRQVDRAEPEGPRHHEAHQEGEEHQRAEDVRRRRRLGRRGAARLRPRHRAQPGSLEAVGGPRTMPLPVTLPSDAGGRPPSLPGPA